VRSTIWCVYVNESVMTLNWSKYLENPFSCDFFEKTFSTSTAVMFPVVLLDYVGCGRVPDLWACLATCTWLFFHHRYDRWFFQEKNLTIRDVQKGSSVPQMEKHNVLKPVIILGVILQTSSVKADRWQVWGPSSNTASPGQAGLNRKMLF
jgi:hypothetical protein